MAAIDKRLAAVCGLHCEACNLYIASTEDPDRLAALSRQFGIPEETLRCNGCRSEKRGPYCHTCHMFACTAERGVDFCSQCERYPCEELTAFQAEAPHRAELWTDLNAIRDAGWEAWQCMVRRIYTCPSCGTTNSAYDRSCRACGETPSCRFAARHGPAIEAFLAKWEARDEGDIG